jgi:hypothetical protein
MMRLIRQFLGVILFLLGIYVIGKDIVFTTQVSFYWWQRIPATGSVLSLLGGLWVLFNTRRRNHWIGWSLIGLGVALVFLSSGIVLRPVTLWAFLLSFFLIFAGQKLMTARRF